MPATRAHQSSSTRLGRASAGCTEGPCLVCAAPLLQKIAQHGLFSSLGSPVSSLFNLKLFNEDACLGSDIARVPVLSKAHVLSRKGLCSQQCGGDRPGVIFTGLMGCRHCEQTLTLGSRAAEPCGASLSRPLIDFDFPIFP